MLLATAADGRVYLLYGCPLVLLKTFNRLIHA
jgi:hypothetical protein